MRFQFEKKKINKTPSITLMTPGFLVLTRAWCGVVSKIKAKRISSWIFKESMYLGLKGLWGNGKIVY